MASPFVHTTGGNFLPLEAAMTPDAIKFRKSVRQWSKTYNLAARVFNRGDSFKTNLPGFAKYPPVTDFMNEGVSIRPDQYNPIWAGINLGRAALCLGMGRGKTFIGGYLSCYFQRFGAIKHNYPNNMTLVVGPKNVLGEWMTQVPEFFNCTISKFPEDTGLDTDIVVTNYEQLAKLIPHRHKFGIMILDESHKAKNAETKLFNDVAQFSDFHIWHRFTLTGTPILNRPDDLFTQLNWINPYAFDCSYEFMKENYYKHAYIKGRGGRKGFQKSTFDNKYAPRIQRIMDSNGFILPSTSEDVDVRIIREKVPMNKKQANLCTQIAKGYLHLVTPKTIGMNTSPAPTVVQVKSALAKELQISSGFMVAGDRTIRFESPKLARVMEIMKSRPNEQFVLWTMFRETGERLNRAIPTAELIYGATSSKKRMEYIEAFKRGELKDLIMQIKSGNAGLNLQNCTHSIFVEQDWNPAVMDQAIARFARSGQTKTVNIWTIVTEGTADMLPYAAIKSKTKVTKSIMTTHATRQMQRARNGAIKGV